MSNLTRISGLASGMDIDTMVSELMKAQRARLDSLKQKEQQMEWAQTDYRSINNSLRTLRDSTFNMKLTGTYSTKLVSSSNESALTATAGTTAVNGTYSVTVHQLAEGVTRGSQAQLADETDTDGTTKTLKEQFSTLSDSITFTLVGKLGSDGVTRVTKDFTIDTTTTTINQLVSKINEQSDELGISASYDATNNRFFLTTTGIGDDYAIGVSSDSDSLLSSATGNAADSVLNLAIKTGDTPTAGKDASFDFGDAVGMTSSSNKVVVNGITLNLTGSGTSSITVSRDTDAMYNTIKSYIDLYNQTIDTINDAVNEEVYKDYLPLTDDQKEQLSDTQQEQWEEKAKSGMLHGDTYLSGLMSKIRYSMSSIVSGLTSVQVDGKTVTHNTLASIGIVTSSDYLEGGKLYLKNDGADLKAAIENDPDGVMKLFNNSSDIASEKGIAQRLYDVVNNAVSDIIDKAGSDSTLSEYDESFMGDQIRDYKKQISAWEDRLSEMEDRYYDQFTRMEEAISQANTQSAWLAQQFSS